jgi:predicted O-methyltransferase YrrM
MGMIKNRLFKSRFSLAEVVIILVVAMVVCLGVAMFYQVRWLRQLTAATFQNALPDVRVAEEEKVSDSVAYEKEYDFTTDWFTWNIPVWEKALAQYKGKAGVRYLEIGVYEGRSAIWMLENILTDPGARLTGIDLFDGPFKNRCLANLELSGASQKATMITGFSQIVLRDLEPESYDIIYIDGSHSEDDVLEDAVLCSRLLKPDGIMIFDDYRWAGCFAEGTSDAPTDFPKTAIDSFIQCFSDHFDIIHNSYQIILRKKKSLVSEYARA